MRVISWKLLLREAYEEALNSPDESSKTGSLLFDTTHQKILGKAHNQLPRRIHASPDRMVRPNKYKYTEHAERNLIYMAAREGVSTKGKTMVAPWACCVDCGRAIIQSGVSRLVVHEQAMRRTPGRWWEELELAHSMLQEAGVEVVSISGLIGGVTSLLDEKTWHP